MELVSDKLIVNGDGRVIAEQPIQRRGGTTSIAEKDSVSSNSTTSNGIATPPRPAADRDASAGGDALAGNEAWDTPEFRQWLSEVKDLPARKLLEAVETKMAELNPALTGSCRMALRTSPVLRR